MDDTTRRGKTGNSFRAGFDFILVVLSFFSSMLNEEEDGGCGWMNWEGRGSMHVFGRRTLTFDIDMDPPEV